MSVLYRSRALRDLKRIEDFDRRKIFAAVELFLGDYPHPANAD